MEPNKLATWVQLKKLFSPRQSIHAAKKKTLYSRVLFSFLMSYKNITCLE